MVYGGINKWTPPRKSGGIPCAITRFSLSVEIEQADAGRDGRTRLAETKFSGANGDKEMLFIFPVQLTTSRVGSLIRLIHYT